MTAEVGMLSLYCRLGLWKLVVMYARIFRSEIGSNKIGMPFY